MKWHVPPSKSITHRAAILASRFGGTVIGPNEGEDCMATLRCLLAAGARLRRDENAWRFEPSVLQAPRDILHAGNSASTVRLLAPTFCSCPGPVSWDGDRSLRQRPMASLASALIAGGALVRGSRLPLQIQGPLRARNHILLAGSSQVASGLLLAAPFLEAATRVVPPPTSRPYVALTASILRAFGVDVRREEEAWIVAPTSGEQCDLRVEGDWSAALFPLVAAAITGQPTEIHGLNSESNQGDRAVLELLEAGGLRTRWEGDTLHASGCVQLPREVDVSQTPDALPALAILAAYCGGETTFTGAAALRAKESDRLATMGRGLDALGITARAGQDTFTVRGGTPNAGRVDCAGDHRVAMAFQMARLATPGIDVATQSARISWPDFEAQWEANA